MKTWRRKTMPYLAERIVTSQQRKTIKYFNIQKQSPSLNRHNEFTFSLGHMCIAYANLIKLRYCKSKTSNNTISNLSINFAFLFINSIVYIYTLVIAFWKFYSILSVHIQDIFYSWFYFLLDCLFYFLFFCFFDFTFHSSRLKNVYVTQHT